MTPRSFFATCRAPTCDQSGFSNPVLTSSVLLRGVLRTADRRRVGLRRTPARVDPGLGFYHRNPRIPPSGSGTRWEVFLHTFRPEALDGPSVSPAASLNVSGEEVRSGNCSSRCSRPWDERIESLTTRCPPGAGNHEPVVRGEALKEPPAGQHPPTVKLSVKSDYAPGLYCPWPVITGGSGLAVSRESLRENGIPPTIRSRS